MPFAVSVAISSLCAVSFQPPQFKLDPRLARLLGIHTQTRPVIIQALWQYIKTHKLQDPHEREYVICDKYLQQVTVAGASGRFSFSSSAAGGRWHRAPLLSSALCFCRRYSNLSG